MKIVVSKRFFLNILSGWILTTVCNSIMLIWAIFLSSSFLEYLPFIGFAMMFYLFMVLITLWMRKGLQMLYFENAEIIAKAGKKVKCRITTDRPIYYIRFQAKDDMLCWTEYILISNEPIQCKCTTNLLFKYHTKSQIIAPYNMKTEVFLPYTNWIQCFPKKQSPYDR